MREGTPGFSGQRLREARQVRGLSATFLSELTNVSAQAIYQYENERNSPSPHVLARIANAVELPVAFFLLPERSSNNRIVFYRSMSTATKRARNRARARFEWLRDIVTYLSDFVELPDANFPKLDLPDDPALLSDPEIEDAADEVRRYWRMGEGPVANMVLLLENQGAVIARDRLGAETLDGMSQLIENSRPYIIVGTDKGSPARWRFDAAHELGHVILHAHMSQEALDRPELFKRIEDQAHRFASAFLLPLASFGEDLFGISLDAFRSMKPKWNVSIAMMIMRARYAGFLSEDTERKLWIGMSRRRWRTSEPYDEDMAVEEPRLLRRSFELILEQGDQTPADVTARLALPSSDIEALSSLPKGYLAEYSRVSRISGDTSPYEPASESGKVGKVFDMSERRWNHK
jgi:Zn-dependent peptidase ImmA (M78 family)/DNA-binding XRE family transcriptional regulator